MKKIIFILSLFFILSSSHTYAARFGNGKSFGQRSSQNTNKSWSDNNHSQQQQQKQTPQQQHNNPQTPPKSSFASKILPILGGLSIGALLGSLLSGNGLGGGVTTILIALLVAGIAFYIIRKLFSSKKNEKSFHFEPQANYPNMQSSHYNNNYNSNYKSSPDTFFNREEFLRTAKTTFIRMQNAYDNKNLSDIRNFTTPEVFAEIQMQIQERGNNSNQTDVLHINASMVEEYDRENSAASVLFSGQMREQQHASPVEINEIWHFVKNYENNWVIGGIEQKNI